MRYFCAHFGIRGISEVGNTQADALSHNWLPIICTHVIAMGRSFFAVIHTHCHAFLPGSLNPVATADCPATPKLNSTVGFHWTRMVCVLQPYASIYLFKNYVHHVGQNAILCPKQSTDRDSWLYLTRLAIT